MIKKILDTRCATCHFYYRPTIGQRQFTSWLWLLPFTLLAVTFFWRRIALWRGWDQPTCAVTQAVTFGSIGSDCTMVGLFLGRHSAPSSGHCSRALYSLNRLLSLVLFYGIAAHRYANDSQSMAQKQKRRNEENVSVIESIWRLSSKRLRLNYGKALFFHT